MGDVEVMSREGAGTAMHWTAVPAGDGHRIAMAMLILAAAIGCTSSKPARVVDARPATEQAPTGAVSAPSTVSSSASTSKLASSSSSSNPSNPSRASRVAQLDGRIAPGAVEIRALELREGAPDVFVDLEASAPLVWTSFRNPEGKVVIELPNSVAAPRVQDVSPDDGLVASIKVQRETEGSRPMTRLIISTRHEVEHSVTADGLHLQIRLLPLETQAKLVARDPARQPKLAFEPVPPPASATGSGSSPSLQPAPSPPPPLQAVAEGSAPAAAADSAPTAAAPAPANDSGVSNHSEAAGRPVAVLPALGRAGTPDEPAVAPPPSGTPATRLEGIEVLAGEAAAGGGSVVRISGDGDFPYSTFALSDPSRFVLDLPGVLNRSSRSAISVQDSVVQRVRVAQFKPGPKGVARVVFDLKQSVVPRIERRPQALVVSFGLPSPDSAAGLAAPATVAPMAPKSTSPAAAAGVATRISSSSRASESTESVTTTTTTTPNSQPSKTTRARRTKSSSSHAQSGQNSQTAQKAAVPAAASDQAAAPPSDLALRPAATQVALARRPSSSSSPSPSNIEVEDAPAAPPAKSKAGSGLPRVAQTANSLQPAADLGRRQPEATATAGDKLGVDLRPGQKVYTGEPIDLKVTNADVTEVLRTFAQISGLNIVVQPGVTGTVTAELENVPWDQAFEEVLKINNLGYEREGNVIRIAPTNILRQEAQERQQLDQAKALVLPLRTVMRRLSYAQATNVANLLRSGQAGLLTQRGSVIVDERTNTLIIKELPDFLDAVLAVISNLDTPEPQVMIEARIIETTKSFSRTLGIRWGFNGVADAAHGNTSGLVFPNNGAVTGNVDLTQPGNGTLGLHLGNVLNTFTLDLALQAAESEGLVNILSAPKVATLNNQQAYIQSGVQLPVQTVANNTVTVQYINATLRLEVTPQVTAEGTIVMDINISKKEPNTGLLVPNAASAPISTKDAKTRLVVRDGGTAVIGGIYKVTTDSNEARVPGLASLPIVGHLFRNKHRDQTNDELLIFITPRVIKI